jgi:hypothetical protein
MTQQQCISSPSWFRVSVTDGSILNGTSDAPTLVSYNPNSNTAAIYEFSFDISSYAVMATAEYTASDTVYTNEPVSFSRVSSTKLSLGLYGTSDYVVNVVLIPS